MSRGPVAELSQAQSLGHDNSAATIGRSRDELLGLEPAILSEDAGRY